jgi:DNA polymerase-1
MSTPKASTSPAVKRVLAMLLKLGKGGEPRGDGYRMQCPAHADHSPSLDIDVGGDGRALVVCRAGCPQAEVIEALGLPKMGLFLTTEEQREWQGGGGAIRGTDSSNSSAEETSNKYRDVGDELETDLKNAHTHTSSQDRGSQETRDTTGETVGLTLDQYAEAKRLPKEFLQRLGLTTVYVNSLPAVSTPYKDREGIVRAVQFRRALYKGDHEDGRFFWSKKGTKPLLYGLWRTESLSQAKDITLTEGASDCHTLWLHDLPALGLPAADAWREEWAKEMDGYARIYIVREPDKGGEAVETWVTHSALRHRVWFVDLGRFKDPSGLYLDSPERFQERWAIAVSQATSWSEAYHARMLREVSKLYPEIKPLLEDPNLLDRLRTAIHEMGYVGDAWAPMLVYLILTSRLLDRPMNGAVIGPSSVGKNMAVDIAREFLPTEEFHAFEASSPLALIYDDADLRHKAVLVGELDSLPDEGPAGSAIRSLAQNNQTVYDVVEKDSKSGKFRTRRICRDGPTVLLTTGTKSPAPQLRTRMLEIHLQDDPQLTHEIIERQAKERGLETPTKPNLQPWKDLQKWLALQASRVRIPFATAIAQALRERVTRPPTRLRRDHPKLLTCIEGITVLYQCQRSRTPGGDLIATLGDYDAARSLLEPVVGTIVHDGVTAAVRQTVVGVTEVLGVEPPESKAVSESALAKHLNLSKTATQYRVRRCLAGGWLVNREERKGRAAQLVLGAPLPDDGPILPTAEEVERYWKGPAPGGGPAPSAGQSVTDAAPMENGDATDPPEEHGTSEHMIGHPVVQQVSGAAPTEIEARAIDLMGPPDTPPSPPEVGRDVVHDREPSSAEVSAPPPTPPAKKKKPKAPVVSTDRPPSVEVKASFDPPPITYVKDAAHLEQVLPDILASKSLAIDTETTGLDPLSDRLRLVQVATPARVVVIDALHCPLAMLAPMLQGDRWLIGQHLKFDVEFLVRAGLPWPSTHLFDTMLGAQVLSASKQWAAEGTYRLENLVEHFLDISLDKSLQTSAWDGDVSADQLRYAAADAAILHPLTKKLTEALKDAKLWKVAALEGSCTAPLAWVELNGMPVDAEQWRVHATLQRRRTEEIAQQLSALAGREVNWNSHPQTLAVLNARGLPVTSTGERVLIPLINDELVATLLEYRQAAKYSQTYGERWLKHAHPGTGRVHADYRQLGSSAGRMSCRQPNLQQIPRERAYRELFRAPEGRCLVKADYSQIELRIAAVIAPDEAMLQACCDGVDLHTLTAAGLVGTRPDAVTGAQRQLAKAVNFGLLFGMGAARLQETAWQDYGVRLSEGEAYQHRARWLELYPGIRRWHNRVGDTVKNRHAIDTHTLYGRRRIGIDRYTEALNSPVQGSGADGLKLALVRLFQHRDAVQDARLVNVVHDELIVECPMEQADVTAAWLKTHMESAMQQVVHNKVPTPVEVHVGQSWAG